MLSDFDIYGFFYCFVRNIFKVFDISVIYCYYSNVWNVIWVWMYIVVMLKMF